MAHIQEKYSGLYKPQDLSVDNISSQKMFIDNIDATEGLYLGILNTIHKPVADITALKAVDTTDGTLYTSGITVYVSSVNSIFTFDRLNTETADDINVIAPSTGAGRWILTTRSLLKSVNNKVALSSAKPTNQSTSDFWMRII